MGSEMCIRDSDCATEGEEVTSDRPSRDIDGAKKGVEVTSDSASRDVDRATAKCVEATSDRPSRDVDFNIGARSITSVKLESNRTTVRNV